MVDPDGCRFLVIIHQKRMACYSLFSLTSYSSIIIVVMLLYCRSRCCIVVLVMFYMLWVLLLWWWLVLSSSVMGVVVVVGAVLVDVADLSFSSLTCHVLLGGGEDDLSANQRGVVLGEAGEGWGGPRDGGTQGHVGQGHQAHQTRLGEEGKIREIKGDGAHQTHLEEDEEIKVGKGDGAH